MRFPNEGVRLIGTTPLKTLVVRADTHARGNSNTNVADAARLVAHCNASCGTICSANLAQHARVAAAHGH